MRSRLVRALAPAIALLASACAVAAPGSRAPGPMTGDPVRRSALVREVATGDVAPLALEGRWIGTYAARTYRRAGAIEVTLQSIGREIGGMLRITGVPTADGRAIAARNATAKAPATRELRVPLVRVAVDGADVRLDSEPYWDPGCGCTVTLQLTGRLVGDTLVGRFRGESAANAVPESAGRWRVVRAATARPATARPTP